ncbi:MAG: T9SS type A sorting domain-containing protein, partial [Bacteroidota bacterium]
VVSAVSLDQERIPEAILANADGTYTLAGYEELPERTSYTGYAHFPFGRKEQRVFTGVYSSTDSLLADRTFLAQEDFNEGGYIFLLRGSGDELIIQGEMQGMLDTVGTVLPSSGNGEYVFMMSFDLPYVLPNKQLDQNLEEDQIVVFPNPTTDVTLVQSLDADFEMATVALYNAQGQRLGQTIQQFEPSLYQINLGALPVGVYQLVIQVDDKIISKPIYKSE